MLEVWKYVVHVCLIGGLVHVLLMDAFQVLKIVTKPSPSGGACAEGGVRWSGM
jgi:hypothetical protein